MSGTLRAGFIGFGFIGKVHAYCHAAMPFCYDKPPARTELFAVCTSRLETAEAAKAKFGFKLATDDWRRITENPDVDVVHVASPNIHHRGQVLSAMAAGKHIYCEKPLTATVEEAREIGRALGAFRGTHQMVLQNRFFPATLRARQLVDEGLLGRVTSFRACYLHSGSVDPNAPLKWKLDRAMGGGVLLDLGVHVIDLTRLLCGEFDEVLMDTSILHGERPLPGQQPRKGRVEAEDQAVMMVKTAGGALGTIEASKIATGSEDELRVEVHGTEGALRFNTMQPNVLEVMRRGDPETPFGGTRGWSAVSTVQKYDEPGIPGPKNSIGWVRSHVACLHNFLSAVATGAKAEPGLDVGIRLQEIMDAAQRSAAGRSWVKCGR
jgi:predicted dehydrogenase